MALLRGKWEAPRDLPDAPVIVGDPPFYEKNGKWFDSKTHEEIQVTVTSWDELFEDNNKKDLK